MESTLRCLLANKGVTRAAQSENSDQVAMTIKTIHLGRHTTFYYSPALAYSKE